MGHWPAADPPADGEAQWPADGCGRRGGGMRMRGGGGAGLDGAPDATGGRPEPRGSGLPLGCASLLLLGAVALLLLLVRQQTAEPTPGRDPEAREQRQMERALQQALDTGLEAAGIAEYGEQHPAPLRVSAPQHPPNISRFPGP